MGDALQGILISGVMASGTSWGAYRLGFFRPLSLHRPPIRLSHLLGIFSIYLGYFFVLPTFLQSLLVDALAPPSLQKQITTHFLMILAMLLTLLLYTRTERQEAFKTAFKRSLTVSTRQFDFGLGLLVWLVAFPWVAAVSQICDLMLWKIFHFEGYEQVAVRYLKDNLESSFQMAIALISIVIIAPIAEEILFRATLQQYLKKFFSIRISIPITAFIFASFHFSPSQGLGNFSLIPSLFVLSCFLGYIYERQGSIYASIGLHVGFNLASSIQILFFSNS